MSKRLPLSARVLHTDKELAEIRRKVNFSGYERSKGVKVINGLLDHISFLQKFCK